MNKNDIARFLAAVALAFYILPVALYVILPGSGGLDLLTGDTLVALLSLLIASIVGVWAAWKERLALIWAAGLVFAAMWFIDGSLLWVVPGLLFLTSAIIATARA